MGSTHEIGIWSEGILLLSYSCCFKDIFLNMYMLPYNFSWEIWLKCLLLSDKRYMEYIKVWIKLILKYPWFMLGNSQNNVWSTVCPLVENTPTRKFGQLLFGRQSLMRNMSQMSPPVWYKGFEKYSGFDFNHRNNQLSNVFILLISKLL